MCDLYLQFSGSMGDGEACDGGHSGRVESVCHSVGDGFYCPKPFA